MITVGTLVAGGLGPDTAERICNHLVLVCQDFDISNPQRQAAFVAQCSIESAGFARTEENLNYTTPGRIMAIFPSKVKSLTLAKTLVRNPSGLANVVYAGVNGNDPDPAVGDGFRYRGRGYLGLTGKTNYANASQDCELPFLDDPDSVAALPGAFQSAASFWDRNGCSDLADKRNWDGITHRINGIAMLQKEDRTEATLRFIRAFT